MKKLNKTDEETKVFKDERTVKYFREEFLKKSTTYIYNTVRFQNDSVLFVANGILREILIYCDRHLEEYDENILNTLLVIFSPSKRYYDFNNQTRVRIAPFGNTWQCSEELQKF